MTKYVLVSGEKGIFIMQITVNTNTNRFHQGRNLKRLNDEKNKRFQNRRKGWKGGTTQR